MSEAEDIAVQMVAEPQHVLVYDHEQDQLAHEIMGNVASLLVESISLSNPSLDNLAVIDSSHDLSPWAEAIPDHVDVWSLADLEEGRTVLDKHQCIVTFGPGILTHALVAPYTHATRFYAAVTRGVRTEQLVSLVHPLREAIQL